MSQSFASRPTNLRDESECPIADYLLSPAEVINVSGKELIVGAVVYAE